MRQATLRRVLIGALILAGLPLATAQAATITVDGNDPATTCTLTDAIKAANSDADEGSCADSGAYGDDTIILETDVTLAAALPEVNSTIVFSGQTWDISTRPKIT
jgi:uncharacterized low-complexity protein